MVAAECRGNENQRVVHLNIAQFTPGMSSADSTPLPVHIELCFLLVIPPFPSHHLLLSTQNGKLSFD